MPNKALSFDEIKAVSTKYSDVLIKESATGRTLFTVYGARLLGMWPSGDGNNPLWVNPGLEQTMSAGQWLTGGERLWIAPERNFFYENPRDFDGFHVPAEIDPGEFVAVGDLAFESKVSLLDYGTNEAFDACLLSRRFELIDDPYGTDCPFAGVRIADSVSIPSTSIEMCGWSLAQTYTCGPDMPATALFPIKAGSSLVSYFNPIPGHRAEVLDGYVRFIIDANEIYKLAIRPEDIPFDNPCKAVYLTPTPDGGSWQCLIKRTNDMPRSQQECVDVARDNPEGPKGAIQSYNNGPGFSPGAESPAFGEIELQLSKGTPKDGRMVSEATHELLAYQGTREQMTELAAKALCLDTAPLLY